MKVLFHIGTEKTGSSFLQQTCGHNRSRLVEHGIWFPFAGKHETRLMTGSISPGNAIELSQFIQNADWRNVVEWLREKTREAGLRKCSRLLLSSERLLAPMAYGRSLIKLIEATYEAGADDLGFLLFVREPVSHALSLYKHRSKNGRLGDITEWLRNDYTLPTDLDALMAQESDAGIELCIRKYTKDSQRLSSIFFVGWLNLPEGVEIRQRTVNPSLTISELRVLSTVASQMPANVPVFYEEFLALPPDLKASDGQVEQNVTRLIEHELSQYADTWSRLDRRLEGDGGLKVPSDKVGSTLEAPTYTFSDAQLVAMNRAYARTGSVSHSLVNCFQRLIRRPSTRAIRNLK